MAKTEIAGGGSTAVRASLDRNHVLGFWVLRRQANGSGTELTVALTSERRDRRQFWTPAGRSANCEGRLRGPNRSTLTGLLCPTVRPA